MGDGGVLRENKKYEKNKEKRTPNEKRGTSSWSTASIGLHLSIHPLNPTKGNWVDGRSNFSWETQSAPDESLLSGEMEMEHLLNFSLKIFLYFSKWVNRWRGAERFGPVGDEDVRGTVAWNVGRLFLVPPHPRNRALSEIGFVLSRLRVGSSVPATAIATATATATLKFSAFPMQL